MGISSVGGTSSSQAIFDGQPPPTNNAAQGDVASSAAFPLNQGASSFMSYADMEQNAKALREKAAADLAAMMPPKQSDMLEMLKDGVLSPEEATKCKRMSMDDKLAMLESWGMKPKHTSKDPSGVDNLFNHVVEAMKQGVGKQKIKFAGSKFKLVIKKGPNGELAAGFKRKKPSIFKRILNVVGKVLKSIGPFLNLIPGVGTLASMAVSAVGTLTERFTSPKK